MSNIYTRLLLNTDKFDKGLFQAQQNLKSFSAQSKSAFQGIAKIGGYAAAFVGISTSIHAAVTANMEFEKSLSSLRSLTGVSAQELNYFRAEAVKMAMDSTQSAVAMVDAYKLIGSQMPELLKNKEALSATARAAVTLAEAAEIDVPTAAKALTGSLNQMGASSASASEYINILAAASQQGSADIPYLNRAIENAGGTASAVGIKFNELVAAIEAIAPRITDASSAGTNLRNIFLTLEASADNNLKPSVVGLSKAIDNLSKKNLNATELTKMFGKESVTAAIALLQEKDAFDKLREGIEGTNTAQEQAGINTDNLAGSISKLQNAWTAFGTTLYGTNGYLKNAVDNLRDAVNWATRALAMSDQQKIEYDNQGNSAEALARMNLYVTQGVKPDLAYRKTMADLTRTMFPDAQFVDKYKKAVDESRKIWEKAKLVNINGAAFEEEKVFKENLRVYQIAVKQKETYDLIDKQLKSHLTSLQAESVAAENARKEAEAAAQAAKDKAAAEEAARQAKEKAENRPEGSIAEIEYEIKELQKKLITATTTQARVAVQETINELQSKKVRLQAEVETAIFQKGKNAPGFVESTTPNLGSMAGGVEMGKFEMPSIQKNIDEADDYAASIANVASAFGMLTGAAQDDQTAMAQWALQTIGNIANVVSQTMGLAAARAAAGGAQAGWPGMMVAIPAAIAAVISAVTSFPKFADGGIVGGSSYFGDKLLARVNSGELILNQKQQESLYHMTEDDRGGGVTIGFDRVRGSDIYLALKNYMKDTGKKL
ncbi:phage tail tape measure protein [Phocaeicola coprocola]|jgi:TP901 family phage tail tape measure protein|uniref:phage tail tape measure protein n=1 Tax=Phocaeicola coprocola TaxID=310298 RepID=UPI00206E1235|nr:MAG TPA: minor tail protein [Caudoviricetes sp.]